MALARRSIASQSGCASRSAASPATSSSHQRRGKFAQGQAGNGSAQARVFAVGDFAHAGARGAHRDGALAAFALHPQWQVASHALLHQQAVPRRGQAGIEHGMRGADAGVAGKRHLAARAEDAQAIAGVRIGGRQHEGGFRQSRPVRDRLHGVVVESLRIQDHGEGVAGTGAVGEDIELDVGSGHGGVVLEVV